MAPHFDPIDVTVPHIAYAVLGGFVVLFGMFSLLLRERLYIGEACWAFIFGVIIGPRGANIFNPRDWANNSEETANVITLELTRVVLAIGVFAIGVELPKAYMRRHWRSLFFLLGPVMIWGWFVSAAFIYLLIPGLNFLSSLAVAACLTPTDPILAAAVVGGKYADKHVPAHIRHLLAAESGCNDGAAFPFLYIALYLILDGNTGQAVSDWFLKLWLYQVILGVIIGSLIGVGFRHLMKFAERHSLIDRHSYVAQYVSLALLTIGLTTLLGSDDLLSAFACGAAFAWDGFFNRQTEESVFSSVIDLLFNVAAFIYIGAWMPFDQFSNHDTTLQVWRLVVLAICVLVLRRLPVMLALYRWIPDIKTFQEAFFTGHFGPIGVGAVFISTLATGVLQESPLSEENHQVELLSKTIQPICAFMVLCSIAVHGLSIPGFSLGKRVHSVSRTWSRHTTATAGPGRGPEWMNNVRHVGPGDVVVNRDDMDLEMGLGGGSGTTGEKVEVHDGRVLEEIDVRQSESPTAAGTPPEKRQVPEGDIPPDGEELVQEWQEGPHRIIERRAGPGEEVEVEVIRNADLDEQSRSAYRGPEAAARGLVERIRGAPHAHIGGVDVEALGRSIEERLGINMHLHQQKGEEEEEEWASEDDNEAGPSSASPASSPERDRRKRTKSRRRSTRKGLLGHAQKLIRPSPEVQPPPSESSGSGATDIMSTARSTDFAYVQRPPAAPTTTRTGRRSRVDSLRLAAASVRPSREASPARSVRFAEPGSGTNTPRASVFGDDVHGQQQEEDDVTTQAQDAPASSDAGHAEGK
ncbi:Sodium/hydrogen exchanger family-domain-containing protein [Roridomyces roridus]|uniref:Sodium/hydrogen exchanger family-domain-containing protein n=1 Tax=Roridomyces roridus TaxID=1738132 RepID=A0AAD7C614_9AGAR|nr:Sodium/hydrogen exchanger family-domain-containing protein [Roridomyces roridus]